MLNVEVWKPIEGFDYSVSNHGNVKNSRGRVLKPWLINSGYLCINLYQDKVKYRFLVHRLVAAAFIGLPEGLVVNHLDSNRINNAADNLEVTTQLGNLQHAKDAGRMEYNKPTVGLKLPNRGESSIKSKYMGVCWVASRNRWVARVVYDTKIYGQSRFTCEETAALWRDALVIAHKLPLPLNFN